MLSMFRFRINQYFCRLEKNFVAQDELNTVMKHWSFFILVLIFEHKRRFILLLKIGLLEISNLNLYWIFKHKIIYSDQDQLRSGFTFNPQPARVQCWVAEWILMLWKEISLFKMHDYPDNGSILHNATVDTRYYLNNWSQSGCDERKCNLEMWKDFLWPRPSI